MTQSTLNGLRKDVRVQLLFGNWQSVLFIQNVNDIYLFYLYFYFHNKYEPVSFSTILYVIHYAETVRAQTQLITFLHSTFGEFNPFYQYGATAVALVWRVLEAPRLRGARERS